MSDIEYPPNCQPINVSNNNSELVKRLKTLSEALQNADSNEECGQPNRYRELVEHLTNSNFLDIGNREVQVWLACCIADLFRLFSPNIPIGDPTLLKDVLVYIVRALKGLDSPSNSLFRRHFYLLENIGAVNTLQLCLELPGEDACVVIRQLIKTSLEIINGKEWAQEVERPTDLLNENEEESGSEQDEKSERRELMVSLLVNTIAKLLREVDQIGNTVLDALFFFMINPQKSNYRESYLLAKNIVQTTYTALEAPVEALLTKSLLVGHLPKECELTGTTTSKLYEVIVELYSAVPVLVASVIPQIGSFLNSEDESQRLLAIKAVGVMVRDPKSRIHEDHTAVWQHYLRRFKDTSKDIRLECTKQAGRILINHSQLRGPTCTGLCLLVRDVDADVRLAAVQVAADTARAKLEAVNEELILACCERMLDKKANIRKETLSRLMAVYAKVVSGEEYTASDRQVVCIIPRKALPLYLNPAMKTEQVLLERYLAASFVPYKLEMTKRVRWMIDVFCGLGAHEMDAFMRIILRNAAYRRVVREMLDIISRTEREEDKVKDIAARINRIANAQPDPASFSAVLKLFTNLLATEQRPFELVRNIVSSEYTQKQIEQCGSDLLDIVNTSKLFTRESATQLRHFLERFSPLLLDNETTAELVRCVYRLQGDLDCGKADDTASRLGKALHLMKTWASGYPHLFSGSSTIETLVRMLQCDNAKTVERTLEVLLSVCSQTSLKVQETEWYDQVVKYTMPLITSDQPGFHRVSKLAIMVMCRLKSRAELFGENGELMKLLPTLLPRLSIDDPACANALRAISMMHTVSPNDLNSTIESIAVDTVAPKLLLSPEYDIDDPMELNPGHPLFSHPMPKYTLIKIQAMKLLARFLCNNFNEFWADKIFKLFSACVSAVGDIHRPSPVADNISPIEKVMLRAVAGSCILRICYTQKYFKLLGPMRWAELASLVTDDVDCVREYFIVHLSKGLTRGRLMVEFFSLFACSHLVRPISDADEPIVKKYRDTCRELLAQTLKRQVQMIQTQQIAQGLLPYVQPEYCIAYAVFLLANQQFLQSYDDVTHLAQLRECVWFLLEPMVANKASFDFELIYRAVAQLKMCSMNMFENLIDGDEMTREEAVKMDKKMWSLADLVMVMIVYRAKVPIRNDPGKAVLTKNFFKFTDKAANKVYAPEELIEDERKRNGRAPIEKKLGNQTTTAAVTKAGRSRRKPATTTRAAKSKARKVDDLEDDDENDIESDVEESEDEVEEVVPAPTKKGSSRGSRVTMAAAKEKEESPRKENGSPTKRGRGRPRKVTVESEEYEAEDQASRSDDDDDDRPLAVTLEREKQKNTSKSPKKNARSSTAGRQAAVAKTNGTKSPAGGEDVPVARRGRSSRSSLEDLPFSPIVKDPSIGMMSHGRGVSGLANSTPLPKSMTSSEDRRKATKRKASATPILEEESDEEQEDKQESPKTKPSPAKKKAAVIPQKKPSTRTTASSSKATSNRKIEKGAPSVKSVDSDVPSGKSPAKRKDSSSPPAVTTRSTRSSQGSQPKPHASSRSAKPSPAAAKKSETAPSPAKKTSSTRGRKAAKK